MKKLILFAAILFAGVSVVKAEGPISKPNYQGKNSQTVTEGVHNNANTNLTVQLNSIQSISVNTSNVSLVYATVEDYTKGVRSGDINEHLEVNSTGGYYVTVSFANASVSGSDGPTDALLADAMFNTINIAVDGKIKMKLNGESAETIISSDTGQFGAKYAVDYQGAANYINSIKGGAVARTYIADVFYTITAL